MSNETLTHYAPHCDQPWIAIHRSSALELLKEYDLTELQKTDIGHMMAGYCNLLDEAGLIHYGQTEAEASRRAIYNVKQSMNDTGVVSSSNAAATVTKSHGQTWMKCPWIWGIEKYVVIETLAAGPLILCEITEHLSGPKRGQLEVTPIHQDQLENCKGPTK